MTRDPRIKGIWGAVLAYAGLAAAAALAVGTAEYFVLRWADVVVIRPWLTWPHRVVAYGWMFGAAAALGAAALAPLRRWLGRAGLRPALLALAFAGAAVVLADAEYFALRNVIYRSPGRAILPLSLAPVALLNLGAGLYWLASRVVVARLWRRRGVAVGAVAVWLAVALVSFAPSPFRSRPRPGAPNIVVVTIDTLRADAVGPAHAGPALMPNVEAFRARGCTFTAARSPAPWTRPALAAMLTGLPPSLHVYHDDDHFDGKLVTVAETLRSAGYDTGAVVSNRVCDPESGFAQGFDYYSSSRERGGLAATPLYYTGLYDTYTRARDLVLILRRGKAFWAEEDTTPRVTNDAVRYIRGRGRRRPYFLWVHYLDPHAPYTPPPRYVSPAARPYAAVKHWDYATNIPLAKELWDGEARYVDDSLQGILAAVEKSGQAGRTVIIITSDHGEEFGDHGGTAHGLTLYQEMLHIPMAMVAPGTVAAGSRCDQPVNLMDVMPTALELAGVPVPPYLAGRSLLGPARGEGSPPREMVGEALVSQDDTRSLEYGDWKLIWFRGRGVCELYSVPDDPLERQPLAMPFVTDGYRRRLEAWEKDTAALRGELGLPASRRSEAAAGAVRALGYVK